MRQRPETSPIAMVGGRVTPFFKGAVSGKWLLLRDGHFIRIEGTGYFRIRWEVEYWIHPGRIEPLQFSEVTGDLIHVASGGGRRLTDVYPNEPGRTLLGKPGRRYSTLQQADDPPWINEYFYLDGSATLVLREHAPLAAINYALTPVTREDVLRDVNRSPDPKRMWLRRGIVRDGC
jgi:hypothetical protein